MASYHPTRAAVLRFLRELPNDELGKLIYEIGDAKTPRPKRR